MLLKFWCNFVFSSMNNLCVNSKTVTSSWNAGRFKTIRTQREIYPFFLIIKPTRCTNFSHLFWNKTLHVSDSSSVYHQEFFTVHTAVGICHTGLLTACERDQDGTSWSCSQAVSKPVWNIPLLCVQWKTPDGRQRNCPKHVEFYSKINLRN